MKRRAQVPECARKGKGSEARIVVYDDTTVYETRQLRLEAKPRCDLVFCYEIVVAEREETDAADR